MLVTLDIQDLKTEAIIGILSHERENPQTLYITATLEYTFEETSFQESLEPFADDIYMNRIKNADEFGYLDYLYICDYLKEIVIQGRYGLLEVALHNIAIKLFHKFTCLEKAMLKLQKPSVCNECFIAVSATFLRHEFKQSL